MTTTTSDAIRHALLAVTAANGGDPDGARMHLVTAHGHARATARRERQVVEVATLMIAGDAERAAGLALEHAAEFPSDAELMTRIEREVSGATAAPVTVVDMTTNEHTYPVRFSVDYPDRPLNRVTTAFRFFAAIPIFIVLAAVSGEAWEWSQGSGRTSVAGAGGLLFFGPLLMILFRRKYPRWWFDFNLELQRFSNRVAAYLALMDDHYPSTTDTQSVHLDYDYPDADRDLNRWLPLVKVFMAIPHFIVLALLDVVAVAMVFGAWFAILFTGRYPKGIFDFVQGVFRWNNRVMGYAFTLVTDQYPPFSLAR